MRSTHFISWCLLVRQAGDKRDNVPRLPALPATVGAYLASLAETHALTTIRRRLAVLGKMRLTRLGAEVFGLTLSEGAIANILARAEAPLLAATAPIAAAVRTSPVVGCDASARVAGKTWWQWVLLGSTAICHLIAESRAACVVTVFPDGARPAVWGVSDTVGKFGVCRLFRA